MKLLPTTGLIIPTANDVQGEGMDRLETSRLLIEQSFIQIDKLLGSMNSTVIRDVEFDNTTNNGDCVYLREDGIFAPALAEFSNRKNVIGIADTERNRLIFIGIAKYPHSTDGFEKGNYLYLSPSVQGKLQVEPPVNSPEILVGIYLGDNSIIINLSTAITDYMQKGIPDGSINTEKLANTVISPFAKDIINPETNQTAKELGLLSTTYPEYTGDINLIFTNSNFSVKSNDITNAPTDFNSDTFAILETKIVSNTLACQVLWSASDLDNLAWFRKKIDNIWTTWVPLNKQADIKLNKEIFYNTLLLGSNYKYCYYNTLETVDDLNLTILPPKFDITNQNLIFSIVGETFYFNPVSSTEKITGFKVIIPENVQQDFNITYAIDNGLFKTTYPNKDNLNTFSNLVIKITGKGQVKLNHFGVLYDIQHKNYSNSDYWIMKDKISDKVYKIEIINGSINPTILS